MIITTHVVAGSAIGAYIDTPLPAFLAGILSHHLLDRIPHLEYGEFSEDDRTNKAMWFRVGLDATVALLSLVLFLTLISDRPGILWASMGSVLPDFLHQVPWWQKYTRSWPITKQYFQFHEWFHRKLRPDKQWLNILLQGAVMAIGLMVIVANS